MNTLVKFWASYSYINVIISAVGNQKMPLMRRCARLLFLLLPLLLRLLLDGLGLLLKVHLDAAL